MVTEVLFASVSALLLGAGQLSLPLVLGGALIVRVRRCWRCSAALRRTCVAARAGAGCIDSTWRKRLVASSGLPR